MEIDEEMEGKIRQEAEEMLKEPLNTHSYTLYEYIEELLIDFAIKILKKYGGRCGI